MSWHAQEIAPGVKRAPSPAESSPGGRQERHRLESTLATLRRRARDLRARERRQAALAMRAKGVSYAEIGRRMGVSSECAAKYCKGNHGGRMANE